MEDLIFVINKILPIILMVVVGYFLKKIKLLEEDMAKKLNTLVFRIFLPVMLFLNVYKIQDLGEIDFVFVWYAMGIIILLFLVGMITMALIFKDNRQRSVMMQGIFRANYALIGLPLAQSLFNDEGSKMAALLSAFVVPTFNILAVICLNIFSAGDKKPSIGGVFKGIIKNPLIQAIFLGFIALGARAIFVRYDITFRLANVEPVYKTLENLSAIASPLSLLVLGARFEISAIPQLKKHIIIGVINRAVIVPFIGISGALLLNQFAGTNFSGAQFASFIACFCTPVAVSSVPMSQEMGADADLMGQIVVWTTVFSAFSIFTATYILRLIGIF